jgi:calcineurin-like phosphoesterase family protein
MIWFTADHHFYHENIIVHCGRPFKNEDHMRRVLLGKFNSLVSPEDVTYFLGDFCWIKSKGLMELLLRKMNGVKVLVLGNHDKLEPFTFVELGFHSVHTSLVVEEFTLVHDPALSVLDRGKPFLCGHVHELFKRQKNVLNVGVDVWDFCPVPIDKVRQEFIE